MEKFVGSAIMLLSIFCYGALAPILKKPSQTLPPFTLMAITMFVLFLISFFASVFFEHSLTVKQSLIKQNLPMLMLFGFINFFAFWLFIIGYKYFPVWQQQMFYLLMPIFGGIIAYFLLGEAINIKLFFGLAIIGVGLFVGLK